MSITLGTPLAEALNAAIQEKLVEIGWSVPGEDTSPLSEYICLMLVNGKNREQIAEELSGDLLGLAKEDDSATVFSEWLFAKVEELNKASGEQQQEGTREDTGERNQQSSDAGNQEGGMDMDTGVDNGAPPTGPKAMRTTTGPRRDRLFNQINRAMDRSQPDNLRRVRPQPGERIEKREPPKGPRAGPRVGGQPQPGLMGAGRGGHMGRINGMGRGGQGFGNGPMGPVPPQLAAQLSTMNPQQQMALYQMIEQQNQILAGFMAQGYQGPPPGMMMPPMPPMPPMPGPNGFRPPHQQFPNQFHLQQQQQMPPQGGSLFERIEAPSQIVNPQQNFVPNGEKSKDESDANEVHMETDEPFFEDTEGAKPEEEDPFKIACKFANNCTKPDCPFAHPTPGAVGRVNISFVEQCPFGVNCKNRKCIGAHPSPASAQSKPARVAKIQADCKFYPNCTNPVCPFRHPDMPLCRNGANCTRPDCHFTHAETPPCRFNPCLNPNCIYTHTEGQQQGAFDNKVWTAGGKKEHVSERKFVTDDGGEEELIIPGQQPQEIVSSEHEEDKPPGSAASTDSSHTMHAEMEVAREEGLMV